MADEAGELARIECGNYGEDTLVARPAPSGAVEIELVFKDGNRRHWIVDGTSRLSISSELWGTVPMLGIETDLELDGEVIIHFEFNFAWGGSHDEDVAKVAVAIAAHTRCALDIQPMRIAGEEHLASIRCGEESQEQLHAIKGETGQVRIVNAMTGVRWNIAAGDTLVVVSDGAGTNLERQGEQIGHFACSEDGVVVFARRVAEAAGCAIDHR